MDQRSCFPEANDPSARQAYKQFFPQILDGAGWRLTVNKPDRIIKCIIVGTPPSVFIRQRINVMPHQQLRVLHTRSEIIRFQTRSISEFFILKFFVIELIPVFRVVPFQRFVRDASH